MCTRLALALFVTCATIAGFTFADKTTISIDDIPRTFAGTFQWRSESDAYDITLVIEKLEKTDDGQFKLSGTHVYDLGNYKMLVNGTINPKTRKVSLRESKPSRADSETNGSFEGSLSDDLKSMNCIWTTKGSGEKGDLKLQVKTAKKKNAA